MENPHESVGVRDAAAMVEATAMHRRVLRIFIFSFSLRTQLRMALQSFTCECRRLHESGVRPMLGSARISTRGRRLPRPVFEPPPAVIPEARLLGSSMAAARRNLAEGWLLVNNMMEKRNI
jgi:hypothetical protein